MSTPDFHAGVVHALRPRTASDHVTCRELSEHLLDFYENQIVAGIDPVAAERQAFAQLRSPARLRRRICIAKGGGMRDSFRKVLLPGVVSAAAVGTYAFIFEQLLHYRAHATFIAPNIAFVSYWYMWPAFLLGGIIGAWYSRFNGGTIRQRLNAGLFLAVVNFCAFVLPFPIAMIIDHRVPAINMAQAMAGYALSQVLVPGIPMLIGTLPFLRKTSQPPQDLAAA